MGVSFEPILQPSKWARARVVWCSESSSKDCKVRLPKSTIGRLFAMLEPRLENSPMLKICTNSGADYMLPKIARIDSINPAFFTPKTTTNSPKLKIMTEMGVSLSKVEILIRLKVAP